MTAVFGGDCVVVGLDQLQVEAQARVAELQARGDDVDANRVLDAYIELRKGLDALGARMAVRGTEILRQHERDTRVRPPGTGELEENLVCEPIVAFGLHGAVGIANYDLLNANVPWWWTQERGYSGNVGRLVFGVFHEPGGFERPDPTMDKQHALFSPRGKEQGKRGSMVIGKPIPARHFLESGAQVIKAEWLALFEGLLATYVAEVRTIP